MTLLYIPIVSIALQMPALIAAWGWTFEQRV
jgi:hypothetical protein